MVSLKSFKLINEAESDISCEASNHRPPQSGELSHPYGQPNLIVVNENARQTTENSINGTIEEQRKGREASSIVGSHSNLCLDDHNASSAPSQKRNSKIEKNDNSKNLIMMSRSELDVGGGQHKQCAEVTTRLSNNNQELSHQSNENIIKNRAVVSVTLGPDTKCAMHDNSDNLSTSNIDNGNPSLSPTQTSSSISIVVVKHDNINERSSSANVTKADVLCRNNSDTSLCQCLASGKLTRDIPQLRTLQSASKELLPSDGVLKKINENRLPSIGYCDEHSTVIPNSAYQNNFLAYPNKPSTEPQYPSPLDPSLHESDSRLSVNTESDHFEIVWSNLSYRIEPKWYKRFNYVDQVLSYFMPGQTIDSHSSANSTASSSAGMNDNQHQMHSSANADSHLSSCAKSRSPSDPIEIFTNLNGTIKSGQMTAVLGPSGAGKTTLLNCLTGKLRKGVSGHINLKGANGKHLKMCTIPQKDHLLEQLTVEENLWFASKIKNPEYGFDHVKNIERVIDLLGLKRCRSAKIKKISGGQHKRVSIAQELLSNPDILVLDEPTSGLDSLTCFKTISMLRDLVELSANNDFMKPMAIIVTIHQPQPKVFNLFHHVYILANGGRVIYEGSPGRSVETITEVTGLQPIDSTKSSSISANAPVDPASFLIEIASEEYGAEVITTLNDYQRRTFRQTLDSRHKFRDAKSCTNLDCNSNSDCKINYAFSLEHEKTTCNDVPRVFEADEDDRQVADATKDSPSIRQQESQTKKSTPRTKRRRGSGACSIESDMECSKRESSQTDERDTDPNLYLSEQLLYTRVPNHNGRFWSHTATLTHRTLLTIRRDPLLMTSRLLFHLMIPILMGHVYGKATGAANACPHYEPEIDITQIPSLVEGKRIEFMLEELHMSIENVSMFFIIMYAFAAAVLALNALSFPLNMQVLLKETRNGWYSMSSYVLAKTLADLPLELTMPCMTMLLVYPLTGQPSSYLQWRMLTICLIMTLCSLIAQTQALILGALVMNSVQTAVFVSQASQLPWVILAGFTIRIKRLSEPLKLISLTSFYRLGCEAITLTRYGFGICPCNPQEITGEPVRLVGIPDQLRSVAQYWIDSVEASKAAAANETIEAISEDSTISSLMTTTLAPTTTIPPTTPKTDIFQHLANQLSYANSYGVNITSCDDVAPDRIRAINLSDNWLVARIWHLFIMLIIMKVLLYYAVRFSIGIRL